MQITRTRSKYYVLSVLGALVVAFGVLAVVPSAQAQQEDPEPPSIDKECNPNPVQVGQQITCTIDVVAAIDPATVLFNTVVTDTFPAGLRVTGATAPCAVAENTVTCGPQGIGVTVTIEATAVQCGTFSNTATAEGLVVFDGPVGPLPDFFPFSVQDTEEITVEGCAVPPEPGPGPGQQQPNQQQGSPPAPITQDFEQDSEAGEIDQTFDIS